MTITYCKKIVYHSENPCEDDSLLFGVIVKEDDNFLVVYSNGREYVLDKSRVKSIKDTKIRTGVR